ncbi:MAG: RIP metalloprotease RseP [Nitrospirae bacterium]|nr:RIP metalloprotease RseP [Nitrospirota bacterium]
MEILYQALAITGMFSLIIVSHEVGHFVAARVAGVKVKKFSLGFGPVLFRTNVRGTEFVISLIQLGGYVELLGEDPEEDVPQQEVAQSFRHQPVRNRALIVLAGAFFNIVLAIFLLTAVYWSGISVLAPEIGTVSKGSPAEEAGMLSGDRIVEINGTHVRIYEDAIRVIQENPGVSLPLKLQRADNVILTTVIPEKRIGYDALNRPSEAGFLGVSPKGTKTVYRQSVIGSLKTATSKSWEMTSLVFSAFVMLLKGQLPLADLAGPIMIVKTASQQMSIGIENFVFTIAFLSVNIGVFNLIPFPALDGGFMIFLLLELLRGKPLKPKTMLLIQRLGVSSLVMLVVFVFYNDLMKLLK